MLHVAIDSYSPQFGAAIFPWIPLSLICFKKEVLAKPGKQRRVWKSNSGLIQVSFSEILKGKGRDFQQ